MGKPCRACRQPRRGHPRVFNANAKTKGWEKTVRGAATAKMIRHDFVGGPVKVTLTFYMPRPGNHHIASKKDRPLKDDAPILHEKKPDLDKLVRAVFDGLAQICFGDDCLVVKVASEKFYGMTVGVAVEIEQAKVKECNLKMIRGEQSQDELPGLAGTRTSTESM